jgi:YD repeat-containing protein
MTRSRTGRIPDRLTPLPPDAEAAFSRPIEPVAPRSPFRIPLIIVLALLALAAVARYGYSYWLRMSPLYRQAIALVEQSQSSRSILGMPVRSGVIGGYVHDWPDAGYGALAIPVSGPSASGTLYVVANRMNDRWDIERAELYTMDAPASGRVIDLTPPLQLDVLEYPAPGKVYLLPLDVAAAADLRDLPSYERARLDVDMTLLPIQPIGPDAIDAKAQQVMAERALDAVERVQRAVLDDLDAVILAVTSQDLNIQTTDWSFATNYRRDRVGIMSTARLHDLPWYSVANPAVYPVRVRKMVTKNVALLHFPIGLSADPTSAVSDSTFIAPEVDAMGASLAGESGRRRWQDNNAPCLTILQGPGGTQSWRVDCPSHKPRDTRLELFTNWTSIPLFVLSRTDFTLPGQPPFDFVREYRPLDDRSRPFGIGANDSFDIFPAGDSETFSQIDLFLADGGRIAYERTSRGTGYEDAKLRARSYMSSPFSLSRLEWNNGGWLITGKDGWRYRFPSSAPGRTPQQAALVAVESPSGAVFGIERDVSSDLSEIRTPDGGWIRFTTDVMHRIVLAKESSGRSVAYDYDGKGRLTHVRDSSQGEEFYDYDALNRLIAVRDGDKRPRLINTYVTTGELREQRLADGRIFRYEMGYDADHEVTDVKVTLPNRYFIEWRRTATGFSRTWPQPSS